MIAAALAIVCIPLAFIVGFAAMSNVELGAFALDGKGGLIAVAVLSIATFCGIFAKYVLELVFIGKRFADAISLRNVILSAVLSPFAMSAVYGLLKEIADHALIGMLAFQNGFFFSNILAFFEHRKEPGFSESDDV